MKRKICAAITLILVLSSLLFALAGCGGDNNGNNTKPDTPPTTDGNDNNDKPDTPPVTGDNGQVPVYQGMTITSAKEATAKAMSHLSDVADESDADGGVTGDGISGNITGADQEINKENPYPENDSNENIEEEIKSSLDVTGSSVEMYCATPNEDVFINIHIVNPDNFEIISFTLNGKKYSSYMFEKGSDMEMLILKYNVGDVSGVVEYTIDAIKYIDGTEIKDVIIDGDKTVKAGVKTENQVTAGISGLDVGTNSLSFDVNVTDKDGLVALSSGELKAVVYDGNSIVAEKTLALGNNAVNFNGLKTSTLYQYAIVGYYDDLSGKGIGINILYKDAFYTDSVVLFDNVTVGQDGISFGYLWHEDHAGKAISALKLYMGDTFVKDIAANATSINNLLSATTYKLVAEYLNAGKTETIYVEFTTHAKTVPEISVHTPTSTKTSVGFSITETDTDSVGAITKIELVHTSGTVVADALDQRTFTNLLSNNTYTVRVTYVYNLNDGSGDKTITKELAVKTDAKQEPTVTITGVVAKGNTIDVNILKNDADNTITKIEAEVLLDDTVVKTQEIIDSCTIEGLLYSTEYSVNIIAYYDLSDGTDVKIKRFYSNSTVTTQNYVDEQGVSYKIYSDGTATVVGFEVNLISDITIPEEVMGHSVTSIGDYAFYYCTSLTSVTIGNSVTSIGYSAFSGCTRLTSVTIGNSVTSIGELAFLCCTGLTSVTIPNSVTSIDTEAFPFCTGLTSVTIPNSVTYIGHYVFYSCDSLTIYCEATSKPSGWSSSWNSSNRPVVWGYKET